MARLLRLIHQEDGQDLVEYSLLVAFVALASAALFVGSGEQVTAVWSSANSVLAVAAPSGGGNGTSSTPPSGGGGHGDR
ncbi:MAG: hypothetical protein U0Q18_33780 [Bryobacteraceae bacterium]